MSDKNFRLIGASNHTSYNRQDNDYYATDPIVIRDLMKVEKFDNKIWEPACGGGHLSKEILIYTNLVFSSDIINRGYNNEIIDFLSSETDKYKNEYDIITNPPYKYALQFCEQAIRLTKNKVAMFLKLTFLEGKKRIF